MKLSHLLFAAAAITLPATAHAAGACDQINGTYVDGRVGSFLGYPSFIAFDRLVLTRGVGKGSQVQVTSDKESQAQHIQLTVTSCTPLTPTTARIAVDSTIPGKGTSGASTVTLTVFDGGSRIWFEGDSPNGKFPGWLLRVPAAPR